MLTPNDAEAIRASYGCYRAAQIAEQYGISRSYVYAIWQYERNPGEAPRGPRPKLTDRQRRHIATSDLPASELAREYGVSRATIHAIKAKARCGKQQTEQFN